MTTPNRTHLAFQHDGELSRLEVVVRSVFPASELDDPNRAAFKGITFTDADHVVVTDQTLFHPQGGGQPSDTGTMEAATTTTENEPTVFTVSAVRMGVPSTSHALQVLHLGTFSPPTSTPPPFTPDSRVTQNLNTAQRLLYSRYHTAGHVLGSAVRHVCSPTTPNFDELKANHFPATASCEFQGLIPGAAKADIQARVDEFVRRDMEVRIEWWAPEDFVREGVERLLPDPDLREALGMVEGDKYRVVRIVGAEVYPCGGTHVKGAAGCGRVTARKISRQKGQSRVSYEVD